MEGRSASSEGYQMDIAEFKQWRERLLSVNPHLQ